MFRFHCSNCGSTGVEFHKDSYGAGNYISCRCGWQFYDVEKIAILYEEQETAYKEVIAAKILQQKKEERKAREARRVRVIEMSSKLCAWSSCGKGNLGRKALPRESSKYCSRDCSNRNARYRHRMRAKKEAA